MENVAALSRRRIFASRRVIMTLQVLSAVRLPGLEHVCPPRGSHHVSPLLRVLTGRCTLQYLYISTISISISTISTTGGGGGPLRARHPRGAAEPGDGAAARTRGHAALGTRHVPAAAPGQVTHYTCLITWR